MVETEVSDATSKRAVAKHYLLNAAGQVVEKEEEATGIRYVHLSTGRTLDYQVPGAVAGTPQTMGAVFGFKTLATNEASAMRQKEGDNSDQVGAIEERFALIDTGQWVDRTREGGPRTDKDLLSQAGINIMQAARVADGQPAYTEAEYQAEVSKLRAKMEADSKVVTLVGKVAGVSAEYAKLAGKSTKTVSDLADLLK